MEQNCRGKLFPASAVTASRSRPLLWTVSVHWDSADTAHTTTHTTTHTHSWDKACCTDGMQTSVCNVEPGDMLLAINRRKVENVRLALCPLTAPGEIPSNQWLGCLVLGSSQERTCVVNVNQEAAAKEFWRIRVTLQLKSGDSVCMLPLWLNPILVSCIVSCFKQITKAQKRSQTFPYESATNHIFFPRVTCDGDSKQVSLDKWFTL